MKAPREWAAELDAALAQVQSLRAIVVRYTGQHRDDEGVCAWCSLDESINDEDADWPCWVSRALAAAPATAELARAAESSDG